MVKSLREKKLQKILEIEQVLSKIQDTDVLLERLLTEAREIVRADAGSIYICEDDKLRIKYAQNNTEQKKLAAGEKLPFVNFSFPINECSIAGYSVIVSKLINIKDAYLISDDKPYSFNQKSDHITGYRTKSVLTLPLISNNKTLGVIQMINALDDDGCIVCFDNDDELFLTHFASAAAQALEKTYLTRSMIMRMIRMAELRDPKETGAHILRVSHYAVEIYDRWAIEHNIDIDERENFRDSLKISAMLHDVGKVGVSDLILKKESSFTEEEFQIMKSHTYIGASLFFDAKSNIDLMARDVAFHHHERWNGTGYPGSVDLSLVLNDNTTVNFCTKGLVGTDIPFAARIVALADVFDALSSKRVYKKAWAEADVLDEIKKQSGYQFDPEIVDIFFKVIDRIRAIQNSFPD